MIKKVMSLVLCFLMIFTCGVVKVPSEAEAQVNEEWVARYNSPGDLSDRAKDITIDSLGNVYVTGGCYHSSWSESDYITIKYDSSGNELWVARYNGTDNLADAANAIALDSWGNVYVTGASWRPHPRYPRPPLEVGDYLTIKYDSSGNQLWVTSYNGTGNFDDQANDIAVDSSGNVYVTGQSHGIGTHYDYATIKYDTNGNELWVARYYIGGRKQEEAEGIAVDDSTGNVYVTGWSGTVAYDSNGNQLWVAGIYECEAIAVGPSGNVYVAGVKNESGTGKDYATIAYDPLGNELWVAIYNGPGNSNDIPSAIAVDSSENVYVTGASLGIGTNYDFATIKYSYQKPSPEATINIDPDTLNLKSKGRWITAYITLNSPYDVNEIDISTVMLEDVIPAEWGDVQNTILMVKFDRSEVEDMIGGPDESVELTVTGELIDGTQFKGSDIIRVIKPP